MELETVLYRVEGNVGIVSLNRTKALNAMSKQIFVDLTTAFDAAEKDDTVRCVVVNAEGRAFCAGGDIPEMKGLDNPEAVFDFYNVAGIFMKKMINFVKPTITVAHGAIAGAGTSLLLAGDIALVSDDAMFMVAFGAVGLIPDCAGHWLLPRACGLNMAKELMMTQRAVKAPEMKELGLCNHVYPKEQLMDEAMKLANKIAKNAPIAVRNCKKAINDGISLPIEKAVEVEEKLFGDCFETHDQVEGMSCFLSREKPKPKAVFTNN